MSQSRVKRFELESRAAIFVHDYESSWMTPLDDPDAKQATLLTMFRDAKWTEEQCATAHVDAPFLPLSDDPQEVDIAERLNRDREERRAEQPAPVVYRVKVSIEYEPLSEEESAKAIAEALARDVARGDRQMKDGK